MHTTGTPCDLEGDGLLPQHCEAGSKTPASMAVQLGCICLHQKGCHCSPIMPVPAAHLSFIVSPPSKPGHPSMQLSPSCACLKSPLPASTSIRPNHQAGATSPPSQVCLDMAVAVMYTFVVILTGSNHRGVTPQCRQARCNACQQHKDWLPVYDAGSACSALHHIHPRSNCAQLAHKPKCWVSGAQHRGCCHHGTCVLGWLPYLGHVRPYNLVPG